MNTNRYKRIFTYRTSTRTTQSLLRPMFKWQRWVPDGVTTQR